jgi:hypothetical protein
MDPDAENDVEVNLKKGKHLFVCLLQDTPKSKPHAMLGMRKFVTVKEPASPPA